METRRGEWDWDDQEAYPLTLPGWVYELVGHGLAGYLLGLALSLSPSFQKGGRMDAVITTLTTEAATLATKVGVVAGIGIGVGIVGFGIKRLWAMFKSVK